MTWVDIDPATYAAEEPPTADLHLTYHTNLVAMIEADGAPPRFVFQNEPADAPNYPGAYEVFNPPNPPPDAGGVLGALNVFPVWYDVNAPPLGSFLPITMDSGCPALGFATGGTFDSTVPSQWNEPDDLVWNDFATTDHWLSWNVNEHTIVFEGNVPRSAICTVTFQMADWVDLNSSYSVRIVQRKFGNSFVVLQPEFMETNGCFKIRRIIDVLDPGDGVRVEFNPGPNAPPITNIRICLEL